MVKNAELYELRGKLFGIYMYNLKLRRKKYIIAEKQKYLEYNEDASYEEDKYEEQYEEEQQCEEVPEKVSEEQYEKVAVWDKDIFDYYVELCDAYTLFLEKLIAGNKGKKKRQNLETFYDKDVFKVKSDITKNCCTNNQILYSDDFKEFSFKNKFKSVINISAVCAMGLINAVKKEDAYEVCQAFRNELFLFVFMKNVRLNYPDIKFLVDNKDIWNLYNLDVLYLEYEDKCCGYKRLYNYTKKSQIFEEFNSESESTHQRYRLVDDSDDNDVGYQEDSVSDIYYSEKGYIHPLNWIFYVSVGLKKKIRYFTIKGREDIYYCYKEEETYVEEVARYLVEYLIDASKKRGRRFSAAEAAKLLQKKIFDEKIQSPWQPK